MLIFSGFRGGGDSLSGAYLFLPDGQAKEIQFATNQFIFVNGPVRFQVLLLLTQPITTWVLRFSNVFSRMRSAMLDSVGKLHTQNTHDAYSMP